MTYVVLVRHGESVWHRENRYAGVSDIALTPRGRDQADRLAAWAGTAGLAAIWASDLSRSRHTADACSRATGVPLRVDRRLRELDFGDAEGLTAAEIAVRLPGVADAFRRDPVGSHFPGGENPSAAARRFTECLQRVSADRPEGRVLVVAHSTVIRLALCRLIGVDLSAYRRVFPYLGSCTLTEIRLQDDEAALMEFNAPIERRPR